MTDLLKQLQSLKTSSAQQASFLFDLKTSARIDKDIIFTLGINGLEELQQVDDTLLLFHSELFTESFANSHCFQETRSASIHNLIIEELTKTTKLISPHFLNPACHKIIEFLIRFYQYHVNCMKEILYAFLPFHCSKFFIRLLQVLNLDHFWSFLGRHQHTGYVLQRMDVVKQCGHEMKLLQGIMATAEFSEIHLKFVVAVVLELVNLISKLNENLMLAIMGFVNKLISNKGDARIMGMCIVAHVARKHIFSPQYLHGIIEDVLETSSETTEKEVFLFNLLIRLHVIPN